MVHAIIVFLCGMLMQVVSEASDAAAKGILYHCHAPRLVPQVCDILTGDKNAKLRKHCSAYLLQVCQSTQLTHMACLSLLLSPPVRLLLTSTAA